MKLPPPPIKSVSKPKPIKEIPKKKKECVVKKGNLQYGTSQLERDFARDFLDKYGIQYIYEYEAKDIGRFYDFAVVKPSKTYITEMKEGLKSVVQGVQYTGIDFLIEVDGGYWHGDPRLVSEDKLTPMQKKNRAIDELKNKWASLHGLPLVRVWEYDIRKNPKKVLEELRKYVKLEEPKGKTRVMKLKSKPQNAMLKHKKK